MNILETALRFGQSDNSDFHSLLDQGMRGIFRMMAIGMMQEEVEALCGSKYGREQESAFKRAGSTNSGLKGCDGENITRPRVRKKQADGSSQEVSLESYQMLLEFDDKECAQRVLDLYAAGVPSREMKPNVDGRFTGKSSVSKLWIKEGLKMMEDLLMRDLSAYKWLAIQIDGIVLSKDITGLAAIGITEEGEKIILGIEIGASENKETVSDLLASITKRGFRPQEGYKLFCVLDGSDALYGAVKDLWKDDAVTQRCLVHKLGNLKGKLAAKHHPKLKAYFERFRHCQTYEDAKQVYDELDEFLKSKSENALKSLEEAGESEMLAFYKLNLPNILTKTFTNTNIIENAYRNTRNQTKRVHRWDYKGKGQRHPERWLTYALLKAEKGFRKIRGREHLVQMKEALRKGPSGGPAGQS